MLVFLYGPPGVGKSTVGRYLAARLHWPLVDLDQVIETRTGQPIPEIFRTQGEPGFRALEAQALQDLVGRYAEAPGAVLALGGGALLHGPSRRLAEAHGPVVLLHAAPETLLARLRRQRGQRPLLPGESEAALRRLLDARAAHYASFQRRVTVDDLTPEEVAWQAQVQAGAFRLEMGGNPSEILVQAGALAILGREMAARFPDRPPVAVVTEERVATHHLAATEAALRQAGFAVRSLVLPPGEATKSVAYLEQVWAFFLASGLDRRGVALALGGGVIGDLVGFAAATYLRGIPWVNLPTSLLAMVDASVGGKTAVDLPAGKNLVGAFHAPRLVVIDPNLLRTLPEDEVRSGLAEVVKHALISDPDLWATLAWPPQDAEALVRRAVAVKVRVVAEDPFESGLREVLNAGHTVGHAIEAALGYRLRHGEAVAIGLALEARLAQHLGLAPSGWGAQVAARLAALGLPTRPPEELPLEAVLPYLARDKKRRAGAVRYALPVAVGEVRPGVVVPLEALGAVWG